MTEGRQLGGGGDGDYCNRNTIVLRLRCVVALPSATAASILLCNSVWIHPRASVEFSSVCTGRFQVGGGIVFLSGAFSDRL